MAVPATTQPEAARHIPVEWCLAGRELTEPRLSPDGVAVAVVVRWQRSAGIIVVPAVGGPERLLTTQPIPAPGRGLGGGCFDWLADSSGIVYVAADGELWCQPLAAAPCRLTVVRANLPGACRGA